MFFAKQNGRQHIVVALALLVMSVLVTACGGPSGLNNTPVAAVVAGQTITMQQYLGLTRFLYQSSHTQDATLASWQLPAGRGQLAGDQRSSLNEYVVGALLDKAATQLSKEKKIDLATLKQQEDAQVAKFPNGLDAQTLAQVKDLIDNGILTKSMYRLIIHVNMLEDAIFPTISVPIAHIKILTVKTLAKAETLRQQLLNGGDWNQLAVQNSIDGAQQLGGEVQGLPRTVFPSQIDDTIFGTTKPDPKAITEPIKSSLGWSIIQVVSITPTLITNLDTSNPILPNVQISEQGAGVTAYLASLEKQYKPDIKVNWCNNVTGQGCGSVITNNS
jgi:hypothetical protein